jgi:hypothetical protein
MMTEQEFRSKYPPEIIELMLKRQKEQGNPKDIIPFLILIRMDKIQKGFNWDETKEGYDFWEDVLINLNFHAFYERYPKDPLLEIIGNLEKIIYKYEESIDRE